MSKFLPLPNKLKENLKSYQLQIARHKNNMTQEQLAKHLGVSTRTISNWEQGGVPRHGAGVQVIRKFIEESNK